MATLKYLLSKNTKSLPPVFSGVRVARSLVFCVMICRSFFVMLSFFFGHCVVCPSIYGSWLPLWYRQTCLNVNFGLASLSHSIYQLIDSECVTLFSLSGLGIITFSYSVTNDFPKLPKRFLKSGEIAGHDKTLTLRVCTKSLQIRTTCSHACCYTLQKKKRNIWKFNIYFIHFKIKFNTEKCNISKWNLA
jgi:hypothetical protein